MEIENFHPQTTFTPSSVTVADAILKSPTPKSSNSHPAKSIEPSSPSLLRAPLPHLRFRFASSIVLLRDGSNMAMTIQGSIFLALSSSSSWVYSFVALSAKFAHARRRLIGFLVKWRPKDSKLGRGQCWKLPLT
ncbi:hypothetical protein NL676_016585 [Syzygium grande]|nr:hypothetical protein NL676_016585 [Syzygium grande]